MTKLNIYNCVKTQNMTKQKKTHYVTKFKNLKGDKTQKLICLKKSNLNCDQFKNPNCDETQKLSCAKTQNSNCE